MIMISGWDFRDNGRSNGYRTVARKHNLPNHSKKKQEVAKPMIFNSLIKMQILLNCQGFQSQRYPQNRNWKSIRLIYWKYM